MSFKPKNTILEQYDIGISGAVPDPDDWTEPLMDRSILGFISVFSAMVFQSGGRIIHGSHPSFTPVIIHQAMRHSGSRDRPPVTLVVSELWAREWPSDRWKTYSKIAEIHVVARVGKGDFSDVETRNQSLLAMRRHLIEQMNVMIAVGGLSHKNDGIIPGVLEEVQLGIQRGMACYVIGGFGGMAKAVSRMEGISGKLRNGLTVRQNKMLQRTREVDSSIGFVFNHLADHPEIIQRQLTSLEMATSKVWLDYQHFLTESHVLRLIEEDAQLLGISNLPRNVSMEELKEYFDRFGHGALRLRDLSIFEEGENLTAEAMLETSLSDEELIKTLTSIELRGKRLQVKNLTRRIEAAEGEE